MNKQEFLAQLRMGLSGLPQADMEERVAFYDEMIDDRTEEGLSEQDAIEQIGGVEQVISQIIADIPITRLVKKRMVPKKKLKAWVIVLLALGSPIWFSLGVAALAVIFSLYVSVWSVIVSVWAAFASLAGCAVGGVIGGVGFALFGSVATGIAVIGSALACAGLSIFAFYGCKEATKSILLLTKRVVLWMKLCLLKKEEA